MVPTGGQDFKHRIEEVDRLGGGLKVLFTDSHLRVNKGSLAKNKAALPYQRDNPKQILFVEIVSKKHRS